MSDEKPSHEPAGHEPPDPAPDDALSSSAAGEQHVARPRNDQTSGARSPATGPDAQHARTPVAHPSYVFLFVVAAVSLIADLGSKAWATARLEDAKGAARRIEVIPDFLSLVFAK